MRLNVAVAVSLLLVCQSITGVLLKEGSPYDEYDYGNLDLNSSNESNEDQTLSSTENYHSSHDLDANKTAGDNKALNTTTVSLKASTTPSMPQQHDWNNETSLNYTSSPSETNDTGVIKPTLEPNATDATSPAYSGPEDWVTNGTAVKNADNSNNTNNEGLSGNLTTTGPPPSNTSATTVNYTTTTTTTAAADVTTTSKPTDLTTTAYNSTARGEVRGNSEQDGQDKGFATDNRNNNNRRQAWAALLGTAIGVGFVGAVIYVILKRRGRRDFSHRKLVEDMSPEPVLRLDNSEPLDLRYNGSAYYNPGLQGDNIQMANFPKSHSS
ncbi:mucin-15 [Denticeps clupeoides]|uniref:Mucin-15 n=1 Tax=Denticeps clupeoides TaxID=299321 RepID=A0AAY4DM74_9TELE|nr:mucin-15 [Denticeps clupeoides]